jgi:hypothetical protein
MVDTSTTLLHSRAPYWASGSEVESVILGDEAALELDGWLRVQVGVLGQIKYFPKGDQLYLLCNAKFTLTLLKLESFNLTGLGLRLTGTRN